MSDQKPNGLSRLRERLSPGRGDVIVANVTGSSDVIVGKNVIKIGTLVVPAVPVFVGVVALIALVALGAYLYFVPDKMPANSFDIAVANFGEIGVDQRVTSTDNSQSFSQQVFAQLRDELAPIAATLPPSLKPVIWHDSMFPTQIRTRIDLIAGDTPELRRQVAETKSKDLGARMLIYGNLKNDDTPATFVPEFFVVPLAGEADEAAGRYQFGSPIPVPLGSMTGTNWVQSLNLSEAMRARQKALTLLVIGLTFDLNGLHEKALGYFQDALKPLEAANDTSGAQVLIYFVGREYLILANKKQAEAEAFTAQSQPAPANAASAQVESLLVKAEEQFTRALSPDANYVRAHAGLGSVWRLRALRLTPQQRIDQPEFLNRAFAEYQTALNSAIKEGDEQTRAKMQIYLSTTFFLKGEALLFHFEWQKAIDAFDESIRRGEKELGNLKQFPRSLGEAYLTLGNVYFDKGIAQEQLGDKVSSRDSFSKAVGYYDQCIGLKGFDPTLVQGAVARCERFQTQVQGRLK